jgi:Ice-binding-like
MPTQLSSRFDPACQRGPLLRQPLALTAMALAALVAAPASAAGLLGSAQDFTILGHETVTNAYGSGAPSTLVQGNVGVSPGSAITGFAPLDASAQAGVVTGGSIHLADGLAATAMTDAQSAYSQLQSLVPDTVLTGQNLGSFTGALTPGVYVLGGGALLDGTLTLDFGANPSGSFVFQIGSTLITGTGAIVSVLNAGPASSIYWQVGSSATLGAGTDFAGNVLANTSVTLNSGAEILGGRTFALNGAVTLIDNGITGDCFANPLGGQSCLDGGSLGYSGGITSPVPEPSAVLMMISGFAVLGLGTRRRNLVVSHACVPAGLARCP